MLLYGSIIKNGEKAMDIELKEQMMKSIDVARESTKNCMQVSMESYTEILSRLDLLSFMIMREYEK